MTTEIHEITTRNMQNKHKETQKDQREMQNKTEERRNHTEKQNASLGRMSEEQGLLPVRAQGPLFPPNPSMLAHFPLQVVPTPRVNNRNYDQLPSRKKPRWKLPNEDKR